MLIFHKTVINLNYYIYNIYASKTTMHAYIAHFSHYCGKVRGNVL